MIRRLWTRFEDQLLQDLARQGFNAAELSPQIGRHVNSIRGRARKLGVPLNRRGRRYAMPCGKPETWNVAQRLCAFANIPLPLAEYVASVAEIKGLQVSELRSDSRAPKLVKIRGNIAAIARQHGYTFEAIGRALNRDHTTVIHAIRCHSPEPLLEMAA